MDTGAIILLIIHSLFFIYAFFVIGSYAILAIISALETIEYMKKNSFVNYKEILSSTISPSISIIAPAYNESLNIIENVRSLLSSHYVNYDVIIVNDGSQDDSLEKLIAAYDLVKVNFLINQQIPTKPIRAGIYKSTNPAFEKLTVVDKENGGKADALNMGLNISNNQYVACIDVDCLLLEDALQKMIKPFLEITELKVIATGGVIRIANSCTIRDGKLIDVNLPKKLIERTQILEYLRSFLLGRMAWSRLNGLLVISGAFGLFDRKIAVEVGGYDTNTVGEDMEIIVRMRRHMEEKKLKYKVAYIPDPLCWTEAPDNYKTFISQRNRWTRGTIETLRKHRKIGFNPKYKSLGLLSYPYWFFFERLAPVIEVLGIIYFVILIALNEVRWDYAIAFISLAYLFTILFSLVAIYSEELTYHQYKKKGTGIKLITTILLEPFVLHPFILYAALRGNFDYYFNKNKKWGEMSRKGIQNDKIIEEEESKNFIINMKFGFLKVNIPKYIYLTIALISVFWTISLFELFMTIFNGIKVQNLGITLVYKFLNDFWVIMIIASLLLPVYLLFVFVLRKFGSLFFKIFFALLIIVQFSLVKYSLTTLLNLGADLLGYSLDDVYLTVSSSESMSFMYFLPFIIIPAIFFGLYYIFSKYITNRKIVGTVVILVLLFGSLKLMFAEASDAVYQNKLYYLASDILKFQNEKNEISELNLFERNDYPYLKPFKETKDVLAPFFNINEAKPNIVIIIVEGLGSEFIGENSYRGFTPYLDSLISKSLYWENFLSTTGRTFGVVPSLLGSLPYGETGFLELKETPSHISLISVLKENGYTTSYYSGDQSSFDKKINFLEYSEIDYVIDENKFESEYVKTAGNSGGFSWGYPDAEIFKKTLSSLDGKKQPRLDIVMTLTNHEPFSFPSKEKYLAKVDSILNSSQKFDMSKNEIRASKDIYASLHYTDNAIKDFMNAYAKREDYSNTIFIITGDHRLIPITQKDKLCRFHVPLYIFSPMLKKSVKFKSVSSHWDVTPSLLSFLMNNYEFDNLKVTSWMGQGLDTAKQFRNIHQIPLMRYKGSINDYVYKDYLYSDGELYKINEDFGIDKIKDKNLLKIISGSLLKFKKLNAYVTQRNKIFPDSLNIYTKPLIEFSKEEMAIIKELTVGLNFEQTFGVAKEKAFNKERESAKLLCDYILNELPNHSDARTLKGRILVWEGNYDKAEAEFLNVIKRSPFYEDSYLALLDLYWWSDQDKKSIGLAKKATENEIKNPDIPFKLAKAYERMNNLKSANKIMDSILKLYPENKEFLTFKKSLK